MAFLDRLLPVTVLVTVVLSGVRLALLLLDGLLLVVLRGGERLGEGEIDIGLSGELISALRFLCGACCSVLRQNVASHNVYVTKRNCY